VAHRQQLTSTLRGKAAPAEPARLSFACLLLAAGLLAAFPARADFTAGVRAYESGDYAGAMAAWLPLAEGDDLAAMRNVGQMYRLGLGVPADATKAAGWYRRAADKGFDRAQANLATMHLTGEGVAQDFREAARWFDAAARQGHTISQYNLAVLYERGLGVPRDEARALGWYNLAARAGHPDALQRLSELVERLPAGIDPPASSSAALPPDAAQVTISTPQVRTTIIQPPATEVPAEMNRTLPSAVVGEQRPDESVPSYNVFSWVGRLISGNDTEQQPRTAATPDTPPPSAPPPQPARTVAATPELAPPAAPMDPVAQGLVDYQAHNFAAAARAWQRPAEAGDLRAQYLLGRLYRTGEGLPKDTVQAYLWLNLAARQGHREARNSLTDLVAEMNDEERAAGRTLVENHRAKP